MTRCEIQVTGNSLLAARCLLNVTGCYLRTVGLACNGGTGDIVQLGHGIHGRAAGTLLT